MLHPQPTFTQNVVNRFNQTLADPRVRLFANVRIGDSSSGADLTVPELCASYSAVVLATGAYKDKELGLAGEAECVIAGQDMVEWYNGVPLEARRRCGRNWN
jgi:NADPH-dependent glutamate synthase beta subunit-like oxidoreductase